MELNQIKAVYFVGAGGIGMSAIARYFLKKGLVVAGYDKTPSDLTLQLEKEGMLIHYEEDIEKIPQPCKRQDCCLIIYTPAIPADHLDVDKVTVDGVEKTWFKSATDNGHFWVRKFVNDGSGSVTFDYTDKIEANTPYIIAVPDGTWGEANRLTGKTLVFTGTDQTVGSEKAVASGDFYRFTGTAVSVMLNDIYALNAAGTSFVHGNATVDPFRAYFVASSISYSASALQIVMGENEPTGIRDVDNMPTNSAVYTLDGRRVTGSAKKGVYIINGKKVIK